MTEHSNVDPAEVAKFEALASSWWDLEGQSKPLHDINPLRLGYIAERCQLKDADVIDIGCGGGILSEALAESGARVTGVDMGDMPLDIAKLHAMEAGLEIHYQQSTAEAMAAKHPEQFDAVTCMEMLEHVPDPVAIVKACAELVKPGGDVFLSTLNRHPKAYLLAVLGAEYVLNMLPKGTHDYKRFIRPSELAGWCRQAGLKVENIRGLSYNPLTRTYSLGKDVKVNYLVHCRRV
ncbi:bifunctional 2-polyprenyl-6-hydroxyphenol methylase/3-demethylubiquinol 3-O-methyltransferase UbiG [Methylophaga sp. OBS4]|uniref:bifunctional 2-polyprenyl-6-hydroxyphenol methylase/3-demethylubiquinol 3-O-methyltransferase UbiG n=1 Tax=Methylophaga sp. OBS4 TaxID=2991935 RepID=UPI0022511826|nr:bifunctional 2-polyprenyl-6-hydroxyphenol methylase/3-demethylubiquinol 3-O-methyltransferase UbiG [Methylophaga sp. OBS4]MCX4187274.1 bifunctional 2-polyprenyl-6-hydroxyphenol methylase/3-demethylubiquinol 3-O-methyltransferase UbiG [Methylophaga sp. OBS4]